MKNSNRSNWQKKQLCTCSTLFCTFLYRCFQRLQRETSRNFLVTRFMKEMSYVFSFTFFFTAVHFHLALGAASISHFFTAPTTKKLSSLFFFSRSRSLSPFFSLSFADLPRTFSFSRLSFSCSIFQICGHDNGCGHIRASNYS